MVIVSYAKITARVSTRGALDVWRASHHWFGKFGKTEKLYSCSSQTFPGRSL